MKPTPVQMDSRRRCLIIEGREASLQEKTWQVLSILTSRAPAIVSRAELIDAVWSSNAMTGEKGLNQAIWTLRKVLGDDNRAPRFIRTIPRQGYRWIYKEITLEPIDPPGRQALAGGAVAALAMAIVLAVTFVNRPDPTLATPGEPRHSDTRLVAVKAYRVDRDIHVKFENGCLGILKSRNNEVIGTPVLSSDGARVAITLGSGQSCRLVTVDIVSGEREEYGACPSQII